MEEGGAGGDVFLQQGIGQPEKKPVRRKRERLALRLVRTAASMVISLAAFQKHTVMGQIIRRRVFNVITDPLGSTRRGGLPWQK